jgi:hypothetical protein
VSEELRAVIAELQRADPRILFFDLPKAPGLGELNRDRVLRQAKGQIICHQNDDDLWLPGHIEVLERALEDADFVGAMQVNVGTDGKVRAHFFDLERPEFVEPYLNWKPNNFGAWACNGFGPIFVAHRLEAFLRLPEGWLTTPVGLPDDQVMWHRFLRQPWCRARFLRWPIALHFPSSDRRDWTPEQRAEELRQWTDIIESPDYAVRIWRDVMPDLGDRLLDQSLRNRETHREIAAHEAAPAQVWSEREAFIARIRELEAECAAVREAAATQLADFRTVFDATRHAADERIRQLEGQIEAITRAASVQVKEAQATFDAERSAMADRIRELERVLGAEKLVAGARIRELESQVEAITRAASVQVKEAQMTFDAERSAMADRIRELERVLGAEKLVAGARIRELEIQVEAITRAASAQVKELQTTFDAERSALADRVRELERVLGAEKLAAGARIRELEDQVDAITRAASAQVKEAQATFDAERSAMAASRELETIVAAHEAVLAREQTLRAQAESERNAVLSSRSWRMTAPLRRAVERLRRIREPRP